MKNNKKSDISEKAKSLLSVATHSKIFFNNQKVFTFFVKYDYSCLVLVNTNILVTYRNDKIMLLNELVNAKMIKHYIKEQIDDFLVEFTIFL